MKSRNALYLAIGSCAVATVGFLVIPPVVKKLSAKMYKADLKKEEIDFDNLGPEIVKKEPVSVEERENGN